jgi:hypothetical protein
VDSGTLSLAPAAVWAGTVTAAVPPDFENSEGTEAVTSAASARSGAAASACAGRLRVQGRGSEAKPGTGPGLFQAPGRARQPAARHGGLAASGGCACQCHCHWQRALASRGPWTTRGHHNGGMPALGGPRTASAQARCCRQQTRPDRSVCCCRLSAWPGYYHWQCP